MSRRRPLQPPKWTEEQLETGRQEALAAFIRERGQEGTRAYREAFDEIEPVVSRLFEATSDLRNFRGEVLREDPKLLPAARYLAGPPISADDLETLVGGRLGRRVPDPEAAKRVADVLRSAWDPIRFPWLGQNRGPRASERAAAIRWTAGIWAIERLRTLRRTESSRRQEAAVAEALHRAGYKHEPRLRVMDTLDALPRGSFAREVSLAGSKCDIPVRLYDGRLLALECKVSNSALNSVKRLIRETGGKARAWRNDFGLQVITGAVLAGVYKLVNLLDAQENYGIAIFWEQDLRPLQEFVKAAQ
ncbi:MAG: XamI family restriction endonuclease [Acidothermus sp.]|nr:XamI family restriction endonuclease [Acidothermus sp.]